jgi:hypothetical protein
MKHFFNITVFQAIVSILGAATLCQADNASVESGPRLTLSGSISMEQGQILRSHLQQISYDIRQWLHRDLLRIRLETVINDHLTIVAEPEIKLWFNTFPKTRAASNVPYRQNSFVSIVEGKGTFSLFGNNDSTLRIGVGMFPFKYNDASRNLGEYLFRSGAYPCFISSSFDYPYGRLFGFHVSNSLGSIFKQDLLLHAEIEIQPLHDWSLSYIARAEVIDLVDVGAGINLHRWFPVVGKLTTQEKSNNSYYSSDGTLEHYSFKGIKLMGFASLDPKALLPDDIRKKFGKNDLNIYTEAAVLGLEDRPAFKPSINGTDTIWMPDTVNNYYSDIGERIPLMFGFTFPTCNSYYFQEFYSESAIPMPPKVSYTMEDFKFDRWKWSLNFKKTVTRGFSIIGQCARDHMHHENYMEGDRDEGEALIRSYDWYWMARVQYNF